MTSGIVANTCQSLLKTNIMRDPEVDKIINKLKHKHDTELRGIVTPAEVRRLCDIIRELLNGSQIDMAERKRLTELSELCRCFTVAEANMTSAMYSKYKHQRVKTKEPVTIGTVTDDIPF